MGLKEGRKKQRKLGPASVRRTPKEPRKILDQDTKELPESGRGSSGSVGKNQLGDGQLREACSWAQGTKKDMSHQLPATQKKKVLETDNDLGTNTNEGKPGTLGRAAR